MAQPHAHGRYVKKLRIEAGLSLRDVAARLGLKHVYIGEVERGVRGPFHARLWPLLVGAIPGVTIEELERTARLTKGVQLDLADAPPRYQDLGLMLARRIEERNLKDDTLDQLIRTLRGDDE